MSCICKLVPKSWQQNCNTEKRNYAILLGTLQLAVPSHKIYHEERRKWFIDELHLISEKIHLKKALNQDGHTDNDIRRATRKRMNLKTTTEPWRGLNT